MKLSVVLLTDFLSIKVNNVSYSKQCLNFIVSVNEKQCNITLIYRSPSQSSEELQTIFKKFEFLLDNILCKVKKIGVLVIKQLMRTKTLNP